MVVKVITIRRMGDSGVKARFGERVRKLRRSHGWSQEEFALRVGLDRSYVGGVERGERNVSLENICLIASALGVAPARLFEGWGVSVRNEPREGSEDAASRARHPRRAD